MSAVVVAVVTTTTVVQYWRDQFKKWLFFACSNIRQDSSKNVGVAMMFEPFLLLLPPPLLFWYRVFGKIELHNSLSVIQAAIRRFVRRRHHEEAAWWFSALPREDILRTT